MFTTLRDKLNTVKLRFTTLPISLSNSVQSLIKRTPLAAELIFSYCGAILVQIGTQDAALQHEVAQIHLANPSYRRATKRKTNSYGATWCK